MPRRDDSWLRPKDPRDRDEWDSTSGVSLSEWLRGGPARQAQDEHDRQLGEQISDVFRRASKPQKPDPKRGA